MQVEEIVSKTQTKLKLKTFQLIEKITFQITTV